MLLTLIPALREIVDLSRTLNRRLDIHVVGHHMLSLERAKSVHSALLENGVSADYLKFSGVGSDKALMTAPDPNLQASNRRVTFHIEASDANPAR